MAITTISELKSGIGIGARSNLFRVTIPKFRELSTTTNAESKFTYLCKGAQLPGSTLGLIDVPFIAGRRYKLAGDRTFAEWTTTVLNDQNFIVRQALENLQKDFGVVDYNSPSAKRLTGGDGTDFSDIVVEQYDLTGNLVYSYKLVNAWPSEISTIDLSYDSVDTIEEFTCTWSYDYFVLDALTSTSSVQNPAAGFEG
jgi:hypothetical protein